MALGHDPGMSWQEAASRGQPYNQDIIKAVNRALEELEPEEAALIRLFYMQGVTYPEISALTGRTVHRLEAQNEAAVKKLKALLHEYLGGRFNIPSQTDPCCPICAHPRREEVNRLLRSKSDGETWKRIYQVLREDFNLRVYPVRRIIAHMKYHLT